MWWVAAAVVVVVVCCGGCPWCVLVCVCGVPVSCVWRGWGGMLSGSGAVRPCGLAFCVVVLWLGAGARGVWAGWL